MDELPDKSFWDKLIKIKFRLKKLVSDRLGLTGFRLNRKQMGMISIGVVMVFIFVSLYISNTGYSIYINGVSVGAVKNKSAASQVIAELTREIGEEYDNADIIIGTDLKVEKVRLSDVQPLDKHQLKERIMENMSVKRPGAVLKIDGRPVLSMLDKSMLEKALEDIKALYTEEKQGVSINSVYIKENIEIVEQPVSIKDIVADEQAYKYLTKGTKQEKTYTVKKGDSFWLISKNNNISVEELEVANPGINPKRLQIGQQISLIVPKPFVTVVSEETATYIEKVPFETQYMESSEFYKGESIVKVYGRYGKEEIVAKIVRENGNEISRDIVERKMIEEPASRLVAMGIKPPPPRQGTGTFSYPARGRITSGFGWRWGRVHTGIDIALSKGTPVKAADGGTVKFAGSNGGYGLLVIIDHGEGYETYYGHNSKNMVKKGDKVHKGQTIALSGNTGNSTGPHLHFEVRKFGLPVNPVNYLNK